MLGTEELLFYIFLFLIGLAWGSFGAAAAYRIPREIPLGLFSRFRSYCPHCDKPIAIYDNLPLLSFALLKGKCRKCHSKLSLRYPIIEATTAFFFVLTGYIVKDYSGLDFLGTDFCIRLIRDLYFVWALIVTVFVDLEFRIIPDRFSIGGFVVAMLFSVFFKEPFWIESLLGALMGFGLFFLMAWTYEKLKGIEGLGFGDVKMMAWLGAWIGVWHVPHIILVASGTGLFAGVLAMRKSKQGLKTALPFGPFLAIGAYVSWIMKLVQKIVES